MKKGFTLIELLAVIVILAIIALIATPIVLSIIDDTKESAVLRSAEYYLSAIENSIMKKNLNVGGSFSPNNCIVQSNGNLLCDESDILEVEVVGETPMEGAEIQLKSGKVTDLKYFYIGNNQIIVNNNNLQTIKETPIKCLTYDNLYEYEILDETKCNEYLSDLTGNAAIYCSGEIYGGRDLIIAGGPEIRKELEKREIIRITKTKNEIQILNYTCSDTDVVIPKEINKVPVTVIGPHAFRNNQLASVVIPNTVKELGYASFYQNQLTSIVIPNSVTKIGQNAFRENQLASVVIPNSVETIGINAFFNNELENLVLGKSLKTINKGSFADNKLTNVIIPSSVQTIGEYAFDGNKLTSVTINKPQGSLNVSGAFSWDNGYSDANIKWQ